MAKENDADASPLRPRLPHNVKLLAWASFLNDVASETIFPLLPVLLKEIGAAPSTWG